MAKPDNQPEEALLLLEISWPACIAIPASKAEMLNDIQLWDRKYESDQNMHVVSPTKGDAAQPRVHLIPAEDVTAAKMLAAMKGETK